MWAPVSATAELLCGVRDSADVFGPLKSAAGGLYFYFYLNYEVWLPPHTPSVAHRCLSERRQIHKKWSR